MNPCSLVQFEVEEHAARHELAVGLGEEGVVRVVANRPVEVEADVHSSISGERELVGERDVGRGRGSRGVGAGRG